MLHKKVKHFLTILTLQFLKVLRFFLVWVLFCLFLLLFACGIVATALGCFLSPCSLKCGSF